MTPGMVSTKNDWVIAGGILWIAIYFFIGFKLVQNTEYLVIERFGEFSRIVHSGPRLLCFPGIIDKVVAEDNLRWKTLNLFADEAKDGSAPPNTKKSYHVDFKDGSTPVSMEASYRVGPQGSSTDETDNAIYLFTYAMQNASERESRIEGLLESEAIPRLQELEIGVALVQKDKIAKEVTANARVLEALILMGVELNPNKGLIIPDIALTPEIIAQRQKKLEGASEADKQKALGLGYARSIKAIKEELGCTEKEALQIYNTQRGLETLASLQTNVSFIAPDIKGVLKTMGVVDASPRNHQTTQQRSSP